jgi:hypothetical protein
LIFRKRNEKEMPRPVFCKIVFYFFTAPIPYSNGGSDQSEYHLPFHRL